MAFRSCAVVALAALFSLPALAQDGGSLDGGDVEGDAGTVTDGDAGPVDCLPRCEGEVLHFCDDGEPVQLDCTETNATCGILSEEWGADCLLPEDAACEPGYADGLSRCQGAGDDPPSACCVDEVCLGVNDVDDCRDLLPGAPDRPATANPVAQNTTTSCLGCDSIPLIGLTPLLVGLRLHSRLRRRRR